MSTLDPLLNQIARDTLRLETLKTRRSDSLDFHDLPVWQLRDALKAAHEAGFEAGLQHTKPRNTAALDAFLERYATICGHLERLQALADDHFGYDSEAIHWGHVGTLTHVERQLAEIVGLFEPTC